MHGLYIIVLHAIQYQTSNLSTDNSILLLLLIVLI